MADLFQVTARLRALQRGQAVPIVSQRQVVIQPHARILTLLAMAGEDTSVHAAAVGRFGEAPQVNVIADPRRRDDQYGLLRWLLPMFESYYAECRAAGTFPQIMVARDEGHHLPYRDKPKAGAMKIVARERASSNLEAGTLRHDRAAREKGVANGTVLRAEVTVIDEERIRPQLFEYRLTLASGQDGLHLRAGDVLHTLDDPRVSLRVDGVGRRGSVTSVTATVVNGKRAAKRMSAGTILDLGPEAPNWQAIGNELLQMSNRLANPPWTHGDAMPAAVPASRPMPANLVAAVESLT